MYQWAAGAPCMNYANEKTYVRVAHPAAAVTQPYDTGGNSYLGQRGYSLRNVNITWPAWRRDGNGRFCAVLVKIYAPRLRARRHLGSQSRSILLSWIWSNICNEITCVHENMSLYKKISADFCWNVKMGVFSFVQKYSTGVLECLSCGKVTK